MKLFVVYDEMGNGRLVGVFDSENKAIEIQNINLNYYRIVECELNEISKEALEWLTENQRKKVEAILINKPDSL